MMILRRLGFTAPFPGGARLYPLRGAIWFGGRNDGILTATHMLNIVGRGGVSDSIRLVERFRNGQLISHEFGSCEGL